MSVTIDAIHFAFFSFALILYTFWSKVFVIFTKLFRKRVVNPKTEKQERVPRFHLRLFLYGLRLFSLVVIADSILYVVITVFVMKITYFTISVIILAVFCFFIFSIAIFFRFRDPVYKVEEKKRHFGMDVNGDGNSINLTTEDVRRFLSVDWRKSKETN